MPPVTFSEVNSLPDILDTGRHKMTFPTIQGVDGTQLTLHHSEINLPKRGVAQVGVKFLGSTTNFRGSSESDNQIQVSFYEDSNGTVHKALMQWLRLVRSSRDGTSKLKSDYAQPSRVHIYNTTGEIALEFKIYNMFPIAIDLPQLTEQSGPMKVQATFSIDYITLEGIDDGSEIPIESPATRNRPPNMRGFEGIGGNNSGIGSALSSLNLNPSVNIGPFNLSLNANTPLPVNALTLSQFANRFSNLF